MEKNTDRYTWVATKQMLLYWPSISSSRRKDSPSMFLAVLSLTARLIEATIQIESASRKYSFTTCGGSIGGSGVRNQCAKTRRGVHSYVLACAYLVCIPPCLQLMHKHGHADRCDIMIHHA